MHKILRLIPRAILLQAQDLLRGIVVIGTFVGLFLAFQHDWVQYPIRKMTPNFREATYKFTNDEDWKQFTMPLLLSKSGSVLPSADIEMDVSLDPPYAQWYRFDTRCLEYLEINDEQVMGDHMLDPCNPKYKTLYLNAYLRPGNNHFRLRVRGGEAIKLAIIPVVKPIATNATYRLEGMSSTGSQNILIPLFLDAPHKPSIELSFDLHISPTTSRHLYFDVHTLQELYVNNNKILDSKKHPLAGKKDFDLAPYLHVGENAIRAQISDPRPRLLFNVTPYEGRDPVLFLAEIILVLALVSYSIFLLDSSS